MAALTPEYALPATHKDVSLVLLPPSMLDS